MAPGLVFATVGTTKFDSLIGNITSIDGLNALKGRGYTDLRIQLGNGSVKPEIGMKEGISISYYNFKDSIRDDMAEADLIISHAGAGSCLEALERGKPLLVVTNEDLMHNHQTELAEQLSSDGHLYSCTNATLCNTINKMDLSKLKPFPMADPNIFPKFLNEFMGFSKDE